MNRDSEYFTISSSEEHDPAARVMRLRTCLRMQTVKCADGSIIQGETCLTDYSIDAHTWRDAPRRRNYYLEQAARAAVIEFEKHLVPFLLAIDQANRPRMPYMPARMPYVPTGEWASLHTNHGSTPLKNVGMGWNNDAT